MASCITRGGMCCNSATLSFHRLYKVGVCLVGTLVFAGPFFVTALSVPVLGARVGFWRWSAVLMGFGGVVMIMQPGIGIFSVFSVLPVMAALLCLSVPW